MNRMEILKDFVKYCLDTKQNTKSKKAKITYINFLILDMYSFNGLKLADIEKKQKEINNILKYNSLTIEKIKNNLINE